jgi:hypothetical protein
MDIYTHILYRQSFSQLIHRKNLITIYYDASATELNI